MELNELTKNVLRSARDKTAGLIGEDGMDALKSFKDDLAGAGEQIRQVAREVSEDCGDDVLSNAKSFYSGKAQAAKREVQNSVKKAVEANEEDPLPNSLREDLADTGEQLKQVAKEVISDCDSDVIHNAGAFYGGAAKKAGNKVGNHVVRVRERSEKRKAIRAAARMRRAELRKKLSGKATLVVIFLIVIAILLLSGAFWLSTHHRKKNTTEIPAGGENTAATAEPSLLRSNYMTVIPGEQNEAFENRTESSYFE